MRLRKKADIKNWLNNFKSVSSFDSTGNKFYYVFEDKKRSGKWTLMMYLNGEYSIHGIGDDYCDDDETFLSFEETVDFIWKNRGSLNNTLVK